MNQELMTLDFWQDTVIYEGKTFPVGTLACDALNVPADAIAKMNEQCEKINLLLGMLNAGEDASALFPMAREAALAMLDILSKTPPFSYMDIPKHREQIEKVFTADNALKYMEFAIKATTNSLQLEEVPRYADAMMLQRYTAVFGHLAYSLGEYQKAMLDFAEKSDGNEADRTAEGFAKMFGSYFPPDFSITEGNAWMSTLNNSVQYVSVIRPGENVAKLVKRMHYVSFVGMFRSDLFEGLCVGHAPKKCRICGKWFLTTNARHTKYCGGYAPGDKLHRTCRQIGKFDAILEKISDYLIWFVAAAAVIVILLVIFLLVSVVKLHNRNRELDDLYDEYELDDEPQRNPVKPIQPVKAEKKSQFKKRQDDDFEDDYDDFDDDFDDDDYYDDDFDDDYDDEGISDDTRNVDEFDDYFDDDDFDSFDDYNIKKEKRKKGDTFEMDFIDLD